MIDINIILNILWFQLVSFPMNTNDFHLNLDFRHDIQVRVENPQKIVEPLETYITYRVSTKVMLAIQDLNNAFDLVYFRRIERIILTKNM